MAPKLIGSTANILLVGLAFVIFGLAAIPLRAEPFTLLAPVDRTVGLVPYSLANGDFNGDGKLDTATANFIGNNVGIVFGDGAGGFSAPVFYTAGSSPCFVVAADFNNDSKLDLAVANLNSNNFTILTNNGAGVFTAVSYPSGFSPTVLATADLNGDGRLDVVSSNESANTLVVSLANAGGGFNAPSVISLPNATLKCVVARDVNNDSKVDLITANANVTANNISVLLGDGAGNFGPPTNFAVGPVNSTPYWLAVGDFNGDTKVDLLVTLFNSNKIAFMAGSGTGTFTLTNSFPLNQTSVNDGAVFNRVRDVNGDGKLDVLVACYYSDTIRVLFGDGSGGVSRQSAILVGRQPHTVDVGDFNGDGMVDMNSADDIVDFMSVMINRGGGVFPSSTFVESSVGDIRAADVNGDGRNDLVINASRVLLGNGDGTFASGVNYGSGTATSFLLADLNNDGKPDIVASGTGVNGLRVRMNNGSGNFANTFTLSNDVGQVGVGDFNQDGKIDIVVALPSNTAQNVKFYQGDGLGGFVLISGLTVSGGTGYLLVADFNHDGHPDLAEIDANHENVLVEISTGAYTFSAAATVLSPGGYGVGCGNFTLAAGDVTGDGKVDIVAPGPCYIPGPNVIVGDGNGNFPTTLTVPLPQQPGPVITADFNRDGKLDFATMTPAQITIAYSLGGGQFTTTQYAAGRADSYMAAADFNSDGIPDIAFVQPAPSVGNVFGTTGIRTILSRTQFRGRITADFDGDGKTDLSVFRPSTGSWYILRSSDNSFYGVQFGQNGDQPVPGDYDGDGKTDIALFRPSTGDWYYLKSSDGSFVYTHHGVAGDIPVPADYDGDGRTNIAVFRPSTSTWYTSTDPAVNYGAFQWGFSSDTPVPADYDGDGKSDIAVFRPSVGTWYLSRSSAGYLQQQQGVNGDRPVPFDFDGDGKANIAVFRPSSGIWYRSTNAAANYDSIQWGQSGDALAPGYYDDDNKVDVAIFRNGTWYIFYSSTNTYAFFNFGTTGDIPIPSAFVPQ